MPFYDYIEQNGSHYLSNGTRLFTDSEMTVLLNRNEVCSCTQCASIADTQECVTFEHDGGPYSICNPCFTQVGTHCAMCRCPGTLTINLRNYDTRTGQMVLCQECYRTNYVNCCRCNSAMMASEGYQHEGRYYCTQCATEHFPKCKYCDNRHLGRNICRCGHDKDTGYLTNRYFSVELEVIDPEGSSNTEWKTVHDGSLSEGGREFLSGPMVGKAAIAEVEAECEKIHGFIDQSCGFHIHLDFGQETDEDVKKFAAACFVMQKFAFEVVTSNRASSRYCKPQSINFSDKLKHYPLDQAIYGTSSTRDLNNLKRHKYHDSRYHWFNLHSYFFRGTIEIRQHHGTKDADTILRWAELWLKIADWSKKNSLEKIQNSTEKEILNECGLREDTAIYFSGKKLMYLS